ncbi:hypothetical protein EYR40_010611 [Pleurotus pulmonarius]|nr:hypothetical protein EYR40_010611 [Pleurotus pulmonarius]
MPFLPFEFLHFTAPHLCKYILELRISYCGDSVPAWMDACLSRFINLRELELYGWAGTRREIAAPITEGIASLLSSINLERLVLSFWDEDEDDSDMLLILSACSGTIEDLSMDTLPPKRSVDLSAIPLQALRRLELNVCSLPFDEMSTIVCPNLNAFAFNLHEDYAFELPSWLPASISELSIRASSTTRLPQIKQPLHRLTLQLESYDSDTPWLSEYINHLPFLDELRELIINIGVHSEETPLPLPDFVHYEALHHLLQPIKHSKLAIQITLHVWIPKHPEADELDGIRLQEIERMEGTYSPLLQGGSFLGRLLIVWGDEDRVVTRCEVRSADWKAMP